ncbi:MAG: glycosyltransferase family 4 protein [Desulfobacterales bacterium]|nr:glycosyltransferase family 4 protein [Desulfobacterales bacterium]
MKIAHLCLSNYYADNYYYQENLLSKMHKESGHTVLIVASTLTMSPTGYVFTDSGHYVNEFGIDVVRVDYATCLPVQVMVKLRAYKGVYRILREFSPEIVIFHGVSAFELLTVAKYVRQNPNVKLYADNHGDFNNSAKNRLSKWLLHYIYYRLIIKQTLPEILKVFCISIETMDFVRRVYRIPKDKIEYLPLGGIIFDEDEYCTRRNEKRKELGLNDETILAVQAGKMGKSKKAVETIKTIQNTKPTNIRLLLIGSIKDEIRNEILPLLDDPQIIFAGWKSPDELQSYLCAADLYLQPGGASSTTQNALCCRCPVALNDWPSHKPFIRGNGWLLDEQTMLADVFRTISHDPSQLSKMSAPSLEIAHELLDDQKQAKRFCM